MPSKLLIITSDIGNEHAKQAEMLKILCEYRQIEIITLYYFYYYTVRPELKIFTKVLIFFLKFNIFTAKTFHYDRFSSKLKGTLVKYINACLSV